MKTRISSNLRPPLRALSPFLIAIAVLWAMPRNARAQLFVTQLPSAPSHIGIVSEYHATTGKVIRARFIMGLNDPVALALNGNTLFVANFGSGTVGKYLATTGGAINPGFIRGLNGPIGLAVEGNTLFVANEGSGTVGKYHANTGAAINANFITGLAGPIGLAVKGNTLFVANSGSGAVGTAGGGSGSFESQTTGTQGRVDLGFSGLAASNLATYHANTGAAINLDFITGLFSMPVPVGLAVKGNTLFVANSGSGTVGTAGGGGGSFQSQTTGTQGQVDLGFSGLAASNLSTYDADTGAAINLNFITGLSAPEGLALLGNTLFVTNFANGTVGKYDATTGGAIKASFIRGLRAPMGIAVKSAK